MCFLCKYRKREVNLKVLKVPEIEQKVMINFWDNFIAQFRRLISFDSGLVNNNSTIPVNGLPLSIY